MSSKKTSNHIFNVGEKVRVQKKSWVIDKERAQEGLPAEEKIPIEQNVTGETCEVTALPYWSEEKGEYCVPLKLPNEAVISVPESRLERSAGGSPSAETIAYWKEYFQKERKG